MKKTISIILCVAMLFLFSACSLVNNKGKVEIKKQEYYSMYKYNWRIFNENAMECEPVKASNEKYYFIDFWDSETMIYCLTESEFAKSCMESNFVKIMYEESTYSLNYGNAFKSFGDEYDYIRCLQTYKNYLYVLLDSDCSTIYKIDINNPNNSSLVYQDKNIIGYFFYNDEIYFVKWTSSAIVIEKTDLYGNNPQIIVNGGIGFENARNDEIYNIYASNDYLYFVLRDNGFESNTFLYCRCKTDGTEKEIWEERDESAALAVSEKDIIIMKYFTEEDGNICKPGEALTIDKYDAKSTERKVRTFYDCGADAVLMEEDMALIYPMFYDGRNVEIIISDETFEKTSLGNYNNTKTGKGYMMKISADEIFVAHINEIMENGTENQIIYFEKYVEE